MSRFFSARAALVAPLCIALLALAGCQSDEEKAAEREKLKSELRNELISELNGMVSSEVRIQLQQAVEDHKRRLAEQAAAAKAAAQKPAPAKAAPKKK
jgi:hypothetical protein